MAGRAGRGFLAVQVLVALLSLATSCAGSTPKRSAPSPTTLNRASTSTSSTNSTTSVPPTTATPVDTRILVYGDCKTPTFEPSGIVLTCGDYGWILEDLHWSSWTATKATAVGTFVYNDCNPNCAQGQHHSVPATQVTLTTPVRGAGGQMVWSRLEQSPQPPGYQTGPNHGAPFPLPTQPI